MTVEQNWQMIGSLHTEDLFGGLDRGIGSGSSFTRNRFILEILVEDILVVLPDLFTRVIPFRHSGFSFSACNRLFKDPYWETINFDMATLTPGICDNMISDIFCVVMFDFLVRDVCTSEYVRDVDCGVFDL